MTSDKDLERFASEIQSDDYWQDATEKETLRFQLLAMQLKLSQLQKKIEQIA
jgi:hypothetical protein